MLNLFNLGVKDNDTMTIAYEIKKIMHEINFIDVKVNLPLTSFIKFIYPTYLHYLESVPFSGTLKDLTH